MAISDTIKQIKAEIGEGAQLVAVSKTKPIEAIEAAYKGGQRIFGENKVQELVDKYESLPKDIEWHMIGHLQTNKVKFIAPFVSLIHGVDSFKLLRVINNEGIKNNRVISCLLQVHIAEEESKFGLSKAEIDELLSCDEFKELTNISIKGLMGMATFTSDMVRVRNEFRQLADFFKELKRDYFTEQSDFKEISMGMSGDYKIAVEEGSTLVRVGSLIFGERQYLNE
ncbi:YggS family pyridoxal phosphate-dependent enzyme [Marinilabiliaceae bacterium JC017]|nr:YggS family pyridoxal phosphate-dependent enzyme [Marinilabiliaceae bacterium JC017]